MNAILTSAIDNQLTKIDYDLISNNVVAENGDAGNIKLDASNNRIFIVNKNGNKVTVLNATNYSIITTIVGFNKPYDMCLDLTNSRAFVPNFNGNSISVINLNDYSVTTPISGISNPIGIAINATGKIIVSSYSSNTIKILDGSSFAVIHSESVPNSPYYVAIDNFERIYITSYEGACIYRLGPDYAYQTTMSNSILANPQGITYDTLYNRLLVADYNGSKMIGIDVALFEWYVIEKQLYNCLGTDVDNRQYNYAYYMLYLKGGNINHLTITKVKEFQTTY